MANTNALSVRVPPATAGVLIPMDTSCQAQEPREVWTAKTKVGNSAGEPKGEGGGEDIFSHFFFTKRRCSHPPPKVNSLFSRPLPSSSVLISDSISAVFDSNSK